MKISELEVGQRLRQEDWDSERFIDIESVTVKGDTAYMYCTDEDGDLISKELTSDELDEEWEIVEVEESSEIAQDWLVELESGSLSIVSNLTETQLLEGIDVIRYKSFDPELWIEV